MLKTTYQHTIKETEYGQKIDAYIKDLIKPE